MDVNRVRVIKPLDVQPFGGFFYSTLPTPFLTPLKPRERPPGPLAGDAGYLDQAILTILFTVVLVLALFPCSS